MPTSRFPCRCYRVWYFNSKDCHFGKCLYVGDIHGLLNLLTLMLCTSGKTGELLLETDRIVDDLYYLEDVLSVDEPRLSKMISESLISLLVFPMLLPLLPLRPSNVRFSLSLSLIVLLVYVLVL